jgi:hypothetical protein
MIAVFGFAVAVISGIAVYAAQRSIFGVNTAWKKNASRGSFAVTFHSSREAAIALLPV